MNPVKFKEANTEIRCKPSARDYGADRDTPVFPIFGFIGGGEVITLWRPSWRERVSILMFGRVWLRLLTGGGGPQPAAIDGTYTVFSEEAEQ